VSYASDITADYFRRTGQPGDQSLDAAYQYEVTVLRDMLARLEVILADEGVSQETAERVIRCMLYGSPSRAASEARMRQDAEMVKLLERMPRLPVDLEPWER
jgi:hypothetical protein